MVLTETPLPFDARYSDILIWNWLSTSWLLQSARICNGDITGEQATRVVEQAGAPFPEPHPPPLAWPLPVLFAIEEKMLVKQLMIIQHITAQLLYRKYAIVEDLKESAQIRLMGLPLDLADF